MQKAPDAGAFLRRGKCSSVLLLGPEHDAHVRGPPYPIGVIADIDASEFAEHISLQAFVVGVALHYFHTTFLVDHEAYEDFAVHVLLGGHWEDQVAVERSVQVALQYAAFAGGGSVVDDGFCGLYTAEYEYGGDQERGAGEDGFHGVVVLWFYSHGTGFGVQQLQDEDVIVMNGKDLR